MLQNTSRETNTLYLDCSSGISGDMTVAALLDLGADQDVLMQALHSLPLEGYEIKISQVMKSAIRACDFHVILDAEHENHDHDMAYLHGSSGHETDVIHRIAGSEQDSDAEETKTSLMQEHTEGSGHLHTQTVQIQGDVQAAHNHAHSHHGRGLKEIMEILRAGQLSEGALDLALRIFQIVAQAEAKVHGKQPEEVHFHEVGAVDSIVDIAAAAVCLDNLNIGRVIIPFLSEGQGQVRCQHGLLPIPVPAVTEIVTAHHLPLKVTGVQGELVTPTGAAIAAAICTEFSLPEQFEILRIGTGAGKRDYACAGILRAMLIRELPCPGQEGIQSKRGLDSDEVLVLETNLDDCTGETLGFVMERLLEAGALDVFYIPIYMKKNRPAILLSVICREESRERMEAIIFHHTTSIGIRCQRMQRVKLPREIKEIATPWGDAKVKCCKFQGEHYCYPEYESIARLAEQSGQSYSELYHTVKRLADSEVDQ